jgi:hypothetical protein
LALVTNNLINAVNSADPAVRVLYWRRYLHHVGWRSMSRR